MRPEDAQLLAAFDTLFAGRRDCYAIGRPKAEKPGKYYFTPARVLTVEDVPVEVDVPLTQDELWKHLKGEQCVGIYPILDDNTVEWFACDYDGATFEEALEGARAQKVKLEAAGIHTYLERSRSGRGLHIWAWFDRPLAAVVVRRALTPLLDMTHIAYDRIYPVQDELTGKGYGNLIALPFFGQAVPQGNSVFLAEDGTPISPRDFLLTKPPRRNAAAVLELLALRAPKGPLKTTGKAPHTNGAPGGVGLDYGPLVQTGALKVVSEYGCTFMNHCVKNRNGLQEPIWRRAIQVTAHFEQGRDFAHWISQGQKYNAAAVDRYFDRALQEERAGCRYIQEQWPHLACPGCPNKAPHYLASTPILKLAGGKRNEVERLSDFGEDLKRIEKLQRGHLVAGRAWGIGGLDEYTRLRRGEFVAVGAAPSMGKALAVDAKVLLADGTWTTMGALRVGDRVASVDGEDSVVTGVYPQGVKQLYEVVFSDGRSTEACAEHLWAVEHKDWRRRGVAQRVLRTEDIQALLQDPTYHRRLSIPQVTGDFGVPQSLPVDPWLLGTLLGDGGLTKGTPTITSVDEQVLVGVAATVPAGVTLERGPSISHHLSAGWQGNGLTQALRELELMGLRSDQKFIPPQYLCAARDQRLALLQGLMDTDGCVTAGGQSAEYSTSSRKLAAGVADLVRSLGGLCRIRPKAATYRYRGVRRVGKLSYRLRIRYPRPQELFRLERKRVAAATTAQRKARLSFRTIRLSRVAEAVCISVGHPSSLYVTDDYIVTHNTWFFVNAMVTLARQQVPVFGFSAETGREALRVRILANLAEVDARKLTGEHPEPITGPEWRALEAAAAEVARLPIYLDFTSLTADDVLAQVERVVLRERWSPDTHYAVFFDYLQFGAKMAGDQSEYDRISRLSTEFKFAAKILNQSVVVFSQLRREAEGSQQPDMTWWKNSGRIESDQDVGLIIVGERVEGELAPRQLWITKQREGLANVAIPFTLHQNHGRWQHAGVQAPQRPSLITGLVP